MKVDVLDISPALAIQALRLGMRERALLGRPVSWYSRGYRHTAVPRPDKHEGAWLVTGNRWAGYHDVAFVLMEIEGADTFDTRSDL
jgi:hypothetical protein